MKVDYNKHYNNINKQSLVRIRKIVEEPKVAFTTGDFQRAGPDKFARMVRRVVKGVSASHSKSIRWEDSHGH